MVVRFICVSHVNMINCRSQELSQARGPGSRGPGSRSRTVGPGFGAGAGNLWQDCPGEVGSGPGARGRGWMRGVVDRLVGVLRRVLARADAGLNRLYTWR